MELREKRALKFALVRLKLHAEQSDRLVVMNAYTGCRCGGKCPRCAPVVKAAKFVTLERLLRLVDESM